MAKLTMAEIQRLLDEALGSYERKEYARAEKAVDALLDGNQNFHRGWFLKGVILEETGREEEAQQFYAKAGNVHTMTVRLALQLEESDPQRARRYFDRVLTTDPYNNVMLYHNGLLCEKLGDPEGAKASFQRIALHREVLSRLIIPAGFMIFLFSGAVVMMTRGEYALSWIVVASAVFCLFWLKRDAGSAIAMIRKKRALS